MRVAFVQTRPLFGRVGGNVEGAVNKIKGLGAELVVLPELFNTGYQFRTKKEALGYAEAAPSGPTTTQLIETARSTGTFIVAGIAEKAGRRVYNSSVLVGPRGHISTYRKAHLFSDEKRVFSPGDTPFTVQRVNIANVGTVRIGMMICFDWLFPEAARTLALKGADIICHPSNLVLPHCPESMKVRSMENRVYSITANRVGTERRVKGKALTFIGKSQVVSPEGAVIARAPSKGMWSKVVKIDPKEARSKRVTDTNDIFRDRRSELYFK